MFKQREKSGWGRPNQLIGWTFMRGLGLIYFSAFTSMLVQIEGLIGPNGILPAQEFLNRIALILPEDHYWKYPTLFWLDASDTALNAACLAGMAASCLVVFGFLTRTALIACFALYLSISTAGQDFTSFQWDVLLLESGFLAILLTWQSKIIEFLYRLLIARFMFMSGVVKIASGDPSWTNLSALSYHYETQPLPSPLAYYAYFEPEWWHEACTAAVLFIELPGPFLVFLPRPYRLFAAGSFIVLQTCIMLTGSYTFFNLLTLLLCLFLFDDRDLMKLMPAGLSQKIQSKHRPPGRVAGICAATWASLVIILLATHLWMARTRSYPVKPLHKLVQATMAFSVINNYGPFAVMTKSRNEVIVEGSNDGMAWLEYGFKYKPDALDKPLRWNIPHQPRLDWQLWFVPLGPRQTGDWFSKFLLRLQQGSPEVLALLKDNPFPDRPPRFIRAVLYRYAFTPPEHRKRTGNIWQREKLYEIESVE